jgi:small-conductance mechanosensitive channel
MIGFARLPHGLKGIIFSLVDALLWVFLIIGVLQALGLNNIALAFSGSLAAVGLAFGVGASSLAADILGGIFLAKDRDFAVGDLVMAGEGPTEGVIESMDMRRIRIRDKSGHLHVIPNSVVERKEWILKERRAERRAK